MQWKVSDPRRAEKTEEMHLIYRLMSQEKKNIKKYKKLDDACFWHNAGIASDPGQSEPARQLRQFKTWTRNTMTAHRQALLDLKP